MWSGTEAALRSLLSRLYEGSGLKITLEISTEFVVFLDMTVFVDAHRLVTKCYQKPSNAYLYLPYSSEHPAHVWHAFLRGELIRYVKRCTFFSDYNDMVSLFAGRLRRRGYPQRAMRASFKTVSWALRESYLAIKPKSDVRPNLMTFVTTYSKRLYDSAVPHAFKENLELLRKLPHFRDVQFIMSWRTTQKLSQELVTYKFPKLTLTRHDIAAPPVHSGAAFAAPVNSDAAGSQVSELIISEQPIFNANGSTDASGAREVHAAAFEIRQCSAPEPLVTGTSARNSIVSYTTAQYT